MKYLTKTEGIIPRFLIVIGLVLSCAVVQAKEITGKVIDEVGKPVSGAVAVVMALPDSMLIDNIVTDEKGEVRFDTGVADSVLVTVQMLGYERHTMKAGSDFTIKLVPSATQLQEVVVEAKPEFRSEAGKFVFTPGDLVKRVNRAEDILLYVPMVKFDKQKIEILGANNTIIYVNGKEPRGILADIKTLIKTLPPSCIKRIEIIKNPGAALSNAYDGAILNIVMTYPWDGFVGMANIEGTLGNNAYSTRGSISACYTKDKWAFTYLLKYIGYGTNEKMIYEYEYKNSNPDGIKALTNENHDWEWVNNMLNGFTVNYNFNEKSVLGLNVGVRNLGIHRKKDATSTYITAIDTYSRTTSFRDTVPFGKLDIGANLFYNLQTDNKGSQLDIVFGYDVIESPTNTTMYYPSETLYQTKSSFRLGWGGKVDYRKCFNRGTRLDVGIGYKSSKTDDALDFYDNSNRFIYKENIVSIYGQLSFSYKRTSFSLGLRVEPEFSSCEQRTTGDDYDRRFVAWCPNISFNWDMPWRDQSLSASVRRSIFRPWISSLNPFRVWTNENSYSQGDPYMKPHYNWSFSTTYIPVKSLTVSASCFLSENSYTQLIMPDGMGLMATKWYNMGLMYFIFASCDYTKEITSFWTIKSSLSYDYTHMKLDTGTEMIRNIESGYGFSIENIFNMSKRYGVIGRISYGLGSPISTMSKTNKKWSNSLSVTIDKTWKHWTFSLGAYNLIPYHTKYTFDSQEYHARVRSLNYFPTLTIGINYVFGNMRTKTAKMRDADASSRFGS